jgi:hypothetical protein
MLPYLSLILRHIEVLSDPNITVEFLYEAGYMKSNAVTWKMACNFWKVVRQKWVWYRWRALNLSLVGFKWNHMTRRLRHKFRTWSKESYDTCESPTTPFQRTAQHPS